MIDISDVLDVIEAKIKTGKLLKGLQTLDMGDQVVVEVKLDQALAEALGEVDMCYCVLPETQFL